MPSNFLLTLWAALAVLALAPVLCWRLDDELRAILRPLLTVWFVALALGLALGAVTIAILRGV